MTLFNQASSIFKGGPSTNVNFPDRSPEEAELLREQTAILRQQQTQLQESLRQQNLLQPLLFEQLGIQEQRDAEGKVTGYARAGTQAEIDKLLGERTLAALKGDLPVDPAFERSRVQERATLGEIMARNLGPGWETSTPGADALTKFDAETEGLRYGIRTGTLTTNEALSQARTAQTFGGLMQGGQADLPFIQAGTTIGSTFSGPLQNMLQNRGLSLESNKASAAGALAKYTANLNFIQGMTKNAMGIFGA